MKIGILGCSHSTGAYGLSWTHYLKKKYNCEIVDASTSGVGNEMYIEKIKYILENENVDFLIVQITDPSRLVMGIYGNDEKKEFEKYIKQNVNYNYNDDFYNLSSPRRFKNANYFTFTVRDSALEINRVLENVNPKLINKFFVDYILLSEYNLNLKIFHTLLTIKKLSEIHNKKILFFSWFVDIHELAKKSGYSEIMNEFDIIKGCVNDFGDSINLERIEGDNYHFGSDSQKIIFESYLEKEIDEFIKNNI